MDIRAECSETVCRKPAQGGNAARRLTYLFSWFRRILALRLELLLELPTSGPSGSI